MTDQEHDEQVCALAREIFVGRAIRYRHQTLGVRLDHAKAEDEARFALQAARDFTFVIESYMAEDEAIEAIAPQ